jgi:hypothetical protein
MSEVQRGMRPFNRFYLCRKDGGRINFANTFE